MDRININFKEVMPHVINAYSKVFGEEYRDIIETKLNNAKIIYYLDINGLDYYLNYIRNSKKFECAIKLLDRIGINVEEYKDKIYKQTFDAKTNKILYNYVSNLWSSFDKAIMHVSPLQAFKKDNPLDPVILLKMKLKLINYLLRDDEEKITEETFDAFTKTKRYAELLSKIESYNKIYEEIIEEHEKWKEKIKPFEEVVKNEMKKYNNVFEEYKINFFNEISNYLEDNIEDAIKNKSIDEKLDIIFGNHSLAMESLIESFSKENMEKIMSNDVPAIDKYIIVKAQKDYLEKLGVDIEEIRSIECSNEEEISKYMKFINSKNVQKFIPKNYIISFIKYKREDAYDDALRDYYLNRKDIADAINSFEDDKYYKTYIYNTIKEKKICITGFGSSLTPDEYKTLLFYTIRRGSNGTLSFDFLHECGHIIEDCNRGTGFEENLNIDYKTYDEVPKNPYLPKYRLYERFNETVNDIFTNEAREILQKEGIYLIEPKEYTNPEYQNSNTYQLTKDVLKPLISKFRKEVIDAKIHSKHSNLTKYIGAYNFEVLVDILNKVDYLCQSGLENKIATELNANLIKEYNEQLDRLEKVYKNIDDYYKRNYIDKKNYYQDEDYYYGYDPDFSYK